MAIVKTTVTHTLFDPSESPVQRGGTIALGGFVDRQWRDVQGMTADGQVITWKAADADETGSWAVDLIPNADVASPEHTLYRYQPAQGQPVVFEVISGGPFALSALVVTDPSQWPVLSPTVKGDPGPALNILGHKTDSTGLPTSGEPGEAWITDDDGHLHTWNGTSWTDVGKFAGDDGTGIASAEVDGAGDLTLTLTDTTTLGPWHVAGQDGTAATIAIDPASGGVPHGTPTSVENVGTVNAAILKFLIEQAQDGSQILTGTGTPTGTPPDGTLFLDTGNGNVWRYSSGAWSGAPILNIMGPAGSPTAFELRGTGFPEGVVTASPGTYYTDTAGTNGAWRWLKTSGTGATGWIVVTGDTGWREFLNQADSSLNPGNFKTARMRRINQNVYASCDGLSSITITGSYVDLFNIPSGFNSSIAGASGRIMSDQTPAGYLTFYSTGQLRAYTSSGPWRKGYVITLTNDPWPTTLPGSPV